MLNQCILVGEVIQTYSEGNSRIIALKIQRPTGNRGNRGNDDSYDIIPCVLNEALIDVHEYARLGSTIGVKARIVSHDDSDKLTIEAEKITIINTKGCEQNEA